jgi:hypothetical protein
VGLQRRTLTLDHRHQTSRWKVSDSLYLPSTISLNPPHYSPSLAQCVHTRATSHAAEWRRTTFSALCRHLSATSGHFLDTLPHSPVSGNLATIAALSGEVCLFLLHNPPSHIPTRHEGQHSSSHWPTPGMEQLSSALSCPELSGTLLVEGGGVTLFFRLLPGVAEPDRWFATERHHSAPSTQLTGKMRHDLW